MKFRSKYALHKLFTFLVVIGLLALPGSAQMAAPKGKSSISGTTSLSAAEKELVKNIRLESVKKYTNALASDEMEGRGTMQPGGDKAASWIADRFKELGLKPLGTDGSYLQPIDFTETVFTAESKFEVGGDTFRIGKDYGFVPVPFKKTDTS
ncbi:MAG: hypothetical protein KDB79_06020, partial [Acidobacteria bacterium]|nr:hypothetical protein [Acidobacteriota bacterium]